MPSLHLKRAIFFSLSLVLVALGQVDLAPPACILAALCGYALFWKGMLTFNGKKSRFFAAFLFFFVVSAVHLSWFTADRYVGPLILVFYLLILSALALTFALFSLFVRNDLRLIERLGLASLWTLGEWGRLFFLSGYTWDPVGITLTASAYSLQMASIGGIYALSFWVMFTNLSFLGKNLSRAAFIGMVPYILGLFLFFYHQERMKTSPKFDALLVQTALTPEEKYGQLSLLQQWDKIFTALEPHLGKSLDLMLFPEATVPHGTQLPLYTEHEVKELFDRHFHTTPLTTKPEMSHHDIAQNLATLFQADIVMGLEDRDEKGAYNAAFHFVPNGSDPARYEKRILVPMGEYIPFEWCKKILAQYGIQDSFRAGQTATVFPTSVGPAGLSICYEETFGHLMRQSRAQGSALLLNLTNDVWYPHSRLPLMHYHHGRIRAVEAGIPLLRACNTGVTGATDSLGRDLGMLPYEKRNYTAPPAALHLQVPKYTFSTLYTLFGNLPVLLLSFSCLMSWIALSLKPLPLLSSLAKKQRVS